MATFYSGPLSPLTSLPDTPHSSPWCTPRRNRPNKFYGPRVERNFQVGVASHNHRFIQSPHWHLSDARRQSTGYRGFSDKLDPNRLVLPNNSPPAARLKALQDAGYQLVPYLK